MKKYFIPALLILTAAFYFGCAKKKTNVEFDVQYSTDVVVPTFTAAGQTYTFISSDALTGMSSELSNKNTTADLVGEVKYTDFSIAVKSPTTATLGFIKSVKFYINAQDLPEQQVAFKYNQKKDNDTILLTDKTTILHINDANLKGRFMQSSVFFKCKIEPLFATTQRTLTVTHKIHVKAISN